MFANFFGIVIISASALLIAGLVLRPTPDLPATMNLGLVDKLTESTSPAGSDSSASTDTASESEAPTSGDSDNANSAPAEQASTDNDGDADKAKAEEAVSQAVTDGAKATEEAASQVVTDSAKATGEAAQAVADKVESSTKEVAPAATGLSKEYLEIRRRAIEQAGSAHTRRNKSDSPNMKDQ